MTEFLSSHTAKKAAEVGSVPREVDSDTRVCFPPGQGMAAERRVLLGRMKEQTPPTVFAFLPGFRVWDSLSAKNADTGQVGCRNQAGI